jgi:hypothetical protein
MPDALSYRFSIDTPLSSLVGSSPSVRSSRRVPGGTRMYLEYAGGRVLNRQNPAIRGALVEALREDWALDPRRILRIAQRQDPALARRLDQRATAGDRQSEDLGLLLGALAEGLQARVAGAGEEDPTLKDLGDLMLWPGTTGEINSSGDWALVREDGLLTLEARFTIQPAGEENTFLSVCMTGAADLRALFAEPLTGEQAYERWTRSAPDRAALPITASLRFEAPGPARNGSLTPARRYGSGSANHWRYVRLRRGTFVGRGAITVDTANRAPEVDYLRSLQLDVFELAA